jgi:hypothetical protein
MFYTELGYRLARSQHRGLEVAMGALGEIVRRRRDELGLTVKAVATRADLKPLDAASELP